MAHRKCCARSLRAVVARAQRCNYERTAAPDATRRQVHAHDTGTNARTQITNTRLPLTVTKRPPHRRAARTSTCILRGERWHARARSGRGASRTSCAQAAPRQRAHARARGGHINTRAARQITRVQRALLLRITTMVHVHAWIMIRRLCASQATRKKWNIFRCPIP